MDWINSWIQGIIIAVIINTIIEIIIPDGKNKKYIRTIMGIYTSFIIISPIIVKVTGNNMNFSNLIKKLEVPNYTVQTSINTNEYIESTYISTLKQNIKEKLLKKGYEVITSDIIIENKNNDSYGEVLKITLKLNKTESQNSKIKTIEKVNITNNAKTKTNDITEQEKCEIKEYLEDIYGTSKDNIEIT